MLEDRGVGQINIGTLQRMEKGTRPGEPIVWGKLWEIYGLPLRELYEGLQLPVPTELPTGTLASVLSEVERLPWQGQEMVLAFARNARSYVALGQMERRMDEPPAPAA